MAEQETKLETNVDAVRPDPEAAAEVQPVTTAGQGGNNANENSAISFLSSSNSDSDDFNQGKEGQNDTRRGRRGQGSRSRRRRSPGGSSPYNSNAKVHRSNSDDRKDFQHQEGRRAHRSRSRDNSADPEHQNKGQTNGDAASETAGHHHRPRRERSNGSHVSRGSSQDRNDSRRRTLPRKDSSGMNPRQGGPNTGNGRSSHYRGRGHNRDGGEYVNREGFRYPQMSKPLVSKLQFSMMQRHGLDPQSINEEYQNYQHEHYEEHPGAFCREHEKEPWFMEQYNPMTVFMAKMDHVDLVRSKAEGFFKKMPFDLLDLTKRDEALVEGPQLHKFDPNSRTIYLKQIPVFVARVQLKEAVSSVTTGLEQIILSRPLQMHKFERFAWLVYSKEEQCEAAMSDLETLVIRAPRESKEPDFQLGPNRNNQSVKPVKVAPELPQDHVVRDIGLCKRLIKEVFDAEKEIEFPFEKLETEIESDDAKLDTLLLYLRQVHGFCLYCGVKCDDERTLVGKCASQHLRQRSSQAIDRAVFDSSPLYSSARLFETTYVAQAEKILSKGPEDKPLDPKEDGLLVEKNYKYCLDKTRTVVEGKKYQCTMCDKAFKSPDFVVKHIKNKHEDRIFSRNISFFKDQARQNYCKEHDRVHGPQQQPNVTQGSGGYGRNNQGSGQNRSRYGGHRGSGDHQNHDGNHRSRGGHHDFGGRGSYQNRHHRGGGYMGAQQVSGTGPEDGAVGGGMETDQGDKKRPQFSTKYIDYDDPAYDAQGQKPGANQTQFQHQFSQQQQMQFFKQGSIGAQAQPAVDRQLVSYDDLF